MSKPRRQLKRAKRDRATSIRSWDRLFKPFGERLEERWLLNGQGIAGIEGTYGVAEAHQAQGPLTNNPPPLTPEQMADHAADATDDPAVPVSGDTSKHGHNGTAAASSEGPAAPVLSGNALSGSNALGSDSLNSAGSFVYYQDSLLGTGAGPSGNQSVVGETGVASNYRAVFQTGNWYAAVSGDNGANWQYASPYTTFPASWGGFCCDQRAVEVPSYNMTLWYLQYNPNANTNGVRIAVASGYNNLLDNSWTYWDFTPANFGFSSTNTQLDFPHMEVSNDYAYFSSNVFDLANPSHFLDSVMWRVPLSNLSSGSGFSYWYWTESNGSLGLTSNATSTMYAGTVTGATTMTVYEQPEVPDNTVTPQLFTHNISGLNTTYFATHNSYTPDGYDWSSFSDSRVQTAWVSGSTIGFMWDSSQGTGRAQPFVRTVRLNTSYGIVDQPDLWSSSVAWQYPSLSVDARGDLAGEVLVGGGVDTSHAIYPQMNTLIWDGYSPNPNTSGWENYYAQGSTNGGGNRWGDFTSSTKDDDHQDTWMSGSWASNSAGVTPSFIWYGRQQDNPNILGPLGDVGDTIYTAANTGVGTGTGYYYNINAIWNPTYGRKDVDLYSFQGVAGSSVTLQTFRPTNGQSMDTILRLFDASGNQLAEDDDDPNGGTLYSGMYNYVLPKSGTFYVGVSGYSNFSYNPTTGGSGTGGSIGDYEVYIAVNSVPTDVGDTIYSAQATGVGPATGSYANTSSIGDAPNRTNDVDMYSFFGVAGSTVTITTSLPSGETSLDTYLRLFDPSGVQVAANDDDSSRGTLYSGIYSFVLPRTGTYYAGVSSFDNYNYDPTSSGSGTFGDYIGDYTINVSINTVPTDVGDTMSTALATGISTVPASYSNTSSIGDAPNVTNDVDLYSFYAVGGTSITATTSFPAGMTSMDTILRLFDSSGNQLTYNDDDPNGGTLYSGIYNYVLPQTGTYYIGVSGYANFSYDPSVSGSGTGSSTGDYTLTLSTAPYGWAASDGQGGTTPNDKGSAIAVDPNGNTYVAGLIGNNTTKNDIYVAKFDATGTKVWSREIGASGADAGLGIAVDANGDAYVTGSFASTVNFNPSGTAISRKSHGGTDIFVMEIDPNGTTLWADDIGGTGADAGNAIALSGSNLWLTGGFAGTAYFGTGTGTTILHAQGKSDAFAIELDTAGNYVRAADIGGPNAPTDPITGKTPTATTAAGYGIAATSSNVYLTGAFTGTVDFDPGASTYNITSTGFDSTGNTASLSDAFVLKLTSAGAFSWAGALGGTKADAGNDVAVDASGNVYTTGYFTATADFDPGASTHNLVAAGSTDAYVSKLSPSGGYVWADRLGGKGADRGQGIALAPDGSVYTTGYFSSTADFNPSAGTNNIVSVGSTDVYVSRLNTSGGYISATGFGSTLADQGLGIATDLASNVYVTGSYSGSMSINTGAGIYSLTSTGGTDIFAAKLVSGTGILAPIVAGSDSDSGADASPVSSSSSSPSWSSQVDGFFASVSGKKGPLDLS